MGIMPFNTPDIPIDEELESVSQHPFLDDVNAKIGIAHAQAPVEWDIPEDEFWKQHQRILKVIDKKQLDALVETELQAEIADGVQTIQYQLVTYMTTNGQSPFVSMYINLDDAKTDQEKEDYCKIIREVFLQRIIGIPDARGVFVPTAFPKILYVIDEDNKPGNSFAEMDGKLKSKYWEITYMAAICSAKVMTPDYISAKKMREYKRGDVYPCMGCTDGESVIDYKLNGIRRVESFRRAWNRLSQLFTVKFQPNGRDLYMDTDGVEIYDNQKQAYVKQYRMIRNTQSDWYKVRFSGGRYINVTNDHPFEVIGKGIVLADDIVTGDKVMRQTAVEKPGKEASLNPKGWLAGVAICDACITGQVSFSFGLDETDILSSVKQYLLSEYGIHSYEKEWHRGKSGDYMELRCSKSSSLKHMYERMFGGVTKKERQIPEEAFNDRDFGMSMLAGIIDADGYVNTSGSMLRVQIGSTNEELALQQMMLAISLGYNASIYLNKYSSKKDKYRYRVEFNCYRELIDLTSSLKKQNHFDDDHRFYQNTVISSNTCEVAAIEPYCEEKYSYDVTTESEHFMVNGILSHNCRSFLTVDRFTETYGNIANALNYEPGKHKYFGRFNMGVSTINLPHAALSSHGDLEKFWEIMGERTEINHRYLRKRIERLKGTPSDVAPILWQHGVYARLKPGETIDKLFYHGYATISLGYAGLYECVKYMTGKSHMDGGEGEAFGLKVLQFLNDKCRQWREAEDIDYSVYGTPIENTTYKFAKANQRDFGIIPGITDKNYVTNSYHQHVTEKTDGFTKLKRESKFQELSPGGAISYIEVPDMEDNIPAMMAHIQYMYETIMYAEFNNKHDYCHVCGYDGTIEIKQGSDHKFYWQCPNCGNTDMSKMNVFRRICGYPGENQCNQGRMNEFADRVLHVDVRMNPYEDLEV